MGCSKDKDGVTVYLPHDLRRFLKIAAAEQDTTVSQLIEDCVRSKLDAVIKARETPTAPFSDREAPSKGGR